ncbi:MAG: hypothetical protein OXP37_02155 [Chloroflexota bacterium]|nr:hypothetical protein [Chloroflexota bacterium]
MPYADELLANLVSSFPGNTENIATEALRHVFDLSDASVEALNDVVGSGVRDLEPIAKVRTQVVGADGTQPDLVGFDREGRERALIEVKFWASLTPNQPNGYLARLPSDSPALLMFLAPRDRVHTLWPQLRELVASTGGELEEVDSERRSLRLTGTQKHLMVVSWRGLLDAMAARSRDAGETGVESVIRQIRSLARYADSGAFKPVPEGEDKVPVPNRLRLYKRLVNDATERGVAQEWVSRKGLRATPRRYGYGRYIRIHREVVWFGINNELFESSAQTPLWVHFPDWVKIDRRHLRRVLGMPDEEWAPVELRREVEYAQVLDGVVESLRQVSDAIAGSRHPTG